MSNLIARFVKDESGATAIEYGLIAALIALAIMAKAHLKVHMGGIATAIEFYQSAPTPNLIMPLFTTSTGNLILGCSGVWMSIGILVMRKMMNFEV